MRDETWNILARAHGARAVMSTSIDDATLAAETARQISVLRPLITAQLRGHERTAVDYGCGAGRFTSMLADIVPGLVVGYDPSPGLLGLHPPTAGTRIEFLSGPPENFTDGFAGGFDLIFVAMVLGNPMIDTGEVVAHLVRLAKPGAVLVVIDHMPDEPEPHRWWRFWPVVDYLGYFAAAGVEMRVAGHDRQLENPVTILAGRV